MTPSMNLLDRLLGFGPFLGWLGFRVAGPCLWEGPFRLGLTPGSLSALLRLTIFLGKLGGPQCGLAPTLRVAEMSQASLMMRDLAKQARRMAQKAAGARSGPLCRFLRPVWGRGWH